MALLSHTWLIYLRARSWLALKWAILMNAWTLSKSRGHKQNIKEGSQTQERVSPRVQSSTQALSFNSGCTILHFHQEWASVSLYPHQHFSLEFVLIIASLSGVRSHWGVDLNFLTNTEHLFRYQLPTCMSSDKCLLKSLAHLEMAQKVKKRNIIWSSNSSYGYLSKNNWNQDLRETLQLLSSLQHYSQW